jgi:hypothetical protein
VGQGIISPVSKDVWDYEVSGLAVLSSWLGYRRRDPYGRTSSDLDELRGAGWTATTTKELLQLIWRLERIVNREELQRTLLDRVLRTELIRTADLPEVPDAERKPPVSTGGAEQFEFLY